MVPTGVKAIGRFSRRGTLRSWLLAGACGAILAVAGAPAAQAAVTLTVRNVRGGFDLDFGTVEGERPSETVEVELQFASTGGARYRVYQELPELLRNEQGVRLPEGRLLMQLSRGTTGALATGGITPVAQSRQELFISSPDGASDTVLAAYVLQPGAGLEAGLYRGVIRYTVESMDAGGIVTQTINVRAQVRTTLRIERDAFSPGRIDLGSLGPGDRATPVELAWTVTSNVGAPAELTQELVEPVVNERGESMADDAVQVAVFSEQGDQPWHPLARRPERLLTAERGGTQRLRLGYTITVPADQRAGRYRGMLRLRLSSVTAAQGQELLVPLEVQVREVFTVSVRAVDGQDLLHFGRVPMTGEPVERKLIVEVLTNIGRPYRVLAGLDHALVMPAGQALPDRAVTWSVSSPQHGTVLVRDRSTVPVGEESIYQSDGRGSPDTFEVAYWLAIPSDTPSGVYSGQLRFSITIF